MKMLKKLLAVVLTGAMALTLLTACGGSAVTEKDIADAMSDLAKAQSEDVTFTPRAEERELARKIAALYESTAATATVADEEDEFEKACKNILGCNEGGANENNFVWFGEAFADEIGTSGQAFQFVYHVLNTTNAVNADKLTGKTPENTRYMGTAFCKVTDDDGKPVKVRIVVVTAGIKE